MPSDFLLGELVRTLAKRKLQKQMSELMPPGLYDLSQKTDDWERAVLGGTALSDRRPSGPFNLYGDIRASKGDREDSLDENFHYMLKLLFPEFFRMKSQSPLLSGDSGVVIKDFSKRP